MQTKSIHGPLGCWIQFQVPEHREDYGLLLFCEFIPQVTKTLLYPILGYCGTLLYVNIQPLNLSLHHSIMGWTQNYETSLLEWNVCFVPMIHISHYSWEINELGLYSNLCVSSDSCHMLNNSIVYYVPNKHMEHQMQVLTNSENMSIWANRMESFHNKARASNIHRTSCSRKRESFQERVNWFPSQELIGFILVWGSHANYIREQINMGPGTGTQKSNTNVFICLSVYTSLIHSLICKMYIQKLYLSNKFRTTRMSVPWQMELCGPTVTTSLLTLQGSFYL